MTTQEKKLLDYIVGYLTANGFQPSTADMARALGLRGMRSLYLLLDGLERQGWIDRPMRRGRTKFGRYHGIRLPRHRIIVQEKKLSEKVG